MNHEVKDGCQEKHERDACALIVVASAHKSTESWPLGGYASKARKLMSACELKKKKLAYSVSYEGYEFGNFARVWFNRGECHDEKSSKPMVISGPILRLYLSFTDWVGFSTVFPNFFTLHCQQTAISLPTSKTCVACLPAELYIYGRRCSNGHELFSKPRFPSAHSPCSEIQFCVTNSPWLPFRMDSKFAALAPATSEDR